MPVCFVALLTAWLNMSGPGKIVRYPDPKIFKCSDSDALKVGTDDDENKSRIDGRVCTKTQELRGQQQESELW